jgi:hypothetical protein
VTFAENPPAAEAVEPRPTGILALLDLFPLAWLGLVAYGWVLLLVHRGSPERPQLPGMVAAERAVVPLLCVLTLAAIIKRFARPSVPASEGKGSATP